MYIFIFVCIHSCIIYCPFYIYLFIIWFLFVFPLLQNVMSNVRYPLTREFSLSGILFSSTALSICLESKTTFERWLWPANLYYSFRPLFCLQGCGTVCTESLFIHKLSIKRVHAESRLIEPLHACGITHGIPSVIRMVKNGMINAFKCYSNMLHVLCSLGSLDQWNKYKRVYCISISFCFHISFSYFSFDKYTKELTQKSDMAFKGIMASTVVSECCFILE